jgi:hypothetical protein
MRNVCLSILFVVGGASVVCADPGVVNQQTSNQSASFHAVSKIQTPQAMSDKQLAAIEGAASAYGPQGGVTWPFLNGKK